ncbi:MAPEG family protein [Roseibium algae]|uniref:MAPEG family protein n=1 Tax=Roseibium algae TaxID=3123038 RepID=A0ABU8THS4_9HYPH
MPIIITPIYAGLLALIYVGLSIWVIALRRKLWISIGDKGSEHLLRRQRVHGNFAEYVPLCLVLMICAELILAPNWTIHGLGLMLIFGRCCHAYGVGQEPESLTLRTIGMLLTFATLIAGGLLNIFWSMHMWDFAG